MAIRWHEDDPALLGEAIRFTAAETGFIPRLIEKDYFCSVLLEYLSANNSELTFKGGTCLSKIYAESYRLSEDLDFSISIPTEASRTERSRIIAPLKGVIDGVPTSLPVFRVEQVLTGSNASRQYNAEIA